MKKLTTLLFGIALLLISCGGSETYRGAWKATDATGGHFSIDFTENSFVVTDESGKKTKFDYTQNSIATVNGVSTYGIQLEDGRGYKITFPKSDDETVAAIFDANNVPVFTIGRKNYVKYEELYSLK